MRHVDLKQIRGILRRRKWVFLALFLPIAVIAGVTAFVLEPIYRSESLILIESQLIPDDFVKTTVTGYVGERLKMITQRITSRTKLTEIIERFDLYKDMRQRKPMDEIVGKMRDDIQVQTISAGGKGGGGSATIAFTLSYEGKDPEVVQKVANVLASLYLKENLKSREQRVSITVSFLEEEAKKFQEQIGEYEKKISRFRQAHIGELPGQSQVNFQALNALKDDLDSISIKLELLEDRKFFLEAQVAEMERGPGEGKLTAETEFGASLKELKASLFSLQSKYTENHPDIIRLKKLIAEVEAGADVLSGTGPKPPDAIELEKETDREMEMLRQKISPNPSKEEGVPPEADVRVGSEEYVVTVANGRVREAPSLEAGILFNLEPSERVTVTEIRGNWYRVLLTDGRSGWAHQSLFSPTTARGDGSEKPEKMGRKLPKPRSSDPAYVNLRNQLELMDLERTKLIEERNQIKEKIAQYQQRLENAPVTEMEFSNLVDGFSQARAKYSDILSKLMEARVSQGMESSDRGEKFTIIDAAQLPARPYKPNRQLIVILGVFLAFGAGFAFSALLEIMDTSMKSPDQLARLTGLPVMSAVPELVNREDLRSRRIKHLGLLFVLACATAGGLLYVHYYVSPLGILMIRIQRRLAQMGLLPWGQ